MLDKKLIIGTANFLQEYKGVCIGEEESKKIIKYCVENGVDTFDSAEAYSNYSILKDFNSNIQYKTDTLPYEDLIKDNMILIKHHPVNYDSNFYRAFNGVSVYDPDFVYNLTLEKDSIVQTPFIKPDTLKQLKACGYYIQCRNVIGLFLSPNFKEILKNLWFVDSFVIGVDSLEQTKQNVDKFNEAIS